jgi:uncharacterized lipoprotein
MTINMAISHAFNFLEAEATMLKKMCLISTAALFAAGLAACDVNKTKEGDVQMPKYEVEKTQEGKVDLPKVEVTPPDVDVKKEEKTVEVPTVKTEEKKITVPDVDITPAKDK